MKRCHACGGEIRIDRTVGRQETCPRCGADLHACLNCRFYSPGAYNDCREPQAERVVEKGRANFCDFFAFLDDGARDGRAAKKEDARSRLEELFRKKTS
ncbi:MAG TPA: hypothetical protein PKN59_02835 [Syntrophales bacterium]|nr:hypothetical protein [Syntrophales bacterium]HNS54104.1 hypothetical protein [Syntrophales bacterium]